MPASARGTNRDGRWSVDTNGRLTSDITGRPETVDGWIADNQLTIVADGQSLVFTRDSGA